MKGRVLIIAGSDSGGGAGLQADLKTVTMLGAYGMTAVTALTAQDTLGVHRVLAVEPAFVETQIRLALLDIGVDAIKTGMLVDAEMTSLVARTLSELAPNVPLVVDPVFRAKGGATLLLDSAHETLLKDLLPLATLFTPNAEEAALLTGVAVEVEADLERAADHLIALGAHAVLVKGGHLRGTDIVDLLKTERGEVSRFCSKRIDTRSTHGTGCTLASAIAAGLAQGMSLRDSVARAHAYVVRAIATAPGFGRGHGPLNHAHPLDGQSADTKQSQSK